MARKSTSVIYYTRAFFNMRRCLDEAKASHHPSAEKIMVFKNPHDNQPCQVMHVCYAVDWLLTHHAPGWAQSTYRMTRLGYELVLKQLQQQQKLSPEDTALAMSKLSQAKGLTKRERTKKTSARRKKNLTEQQFQDIRSYVNTKHNKWGKALLVWLLAGVATGLRPNEWQTAKLSERDGRILLTCENFKANEVRSYAKERTIDITDIPPPYLTAVKEHIKTVGIMLEKNLYDIYSKGCADLLRLCNKKLWPKRKANITLYTGRHQFSANAKAEDECDEVTRAAMMGHKTTVTSRESYGRTRHGSKGLTPDIADPSVLLKIQNPGGQPSPFSPQNKNKKS